MTEPTPDTLLSLEDGDVVEVDTPDGKKRLTKVDTRHPNLGGRAGNGQVHAYFERPDGKRVSIVAYHEDKNDKRRADEAVVVNRTKTGGVFDNIDTDRTPVEGFRIE